MLDFLSLQNSSDPLSYRLLRYGLSIQVIPSLRISAFTRTSAFSHDECLLGFELENLNKEVPVHITQISAVSRRWHINRVENDGETSGSLVLAPQEVRFFYARLHKAIDIDRLDLGASPARILQSSIVWEGSTLPLDQFVGDPFVLGPRQLWRHASLIERHPELSSVSICSHFPLYLPEDVDFVLRWRFPSLDVVGQHVIMGINLGLQEELPLGPTAEPLSIRERRENPIRVLVRPPGEVLHDFNAIEVCVIPVAVSVENISNEVSATVLIQFEQRGLDWDSET